MKKFTILMLSLAFVANANAENIDENAIINAEMKKEIPKMGKNEDSQTSASHGTAYKSIISNYYTNDPYFGSPASASR